MQTTQRNTQLSRLLPLLAAGTQDSRGETMPTLTKLYSMEEASKHNTSEDCWIVIDGKVYDVSTYLDDHPGGDDVILGTTGKDATDEFEDAGHSKTARELMETFCIGELEEAASLSTPEMEIESKEQNLKDLPRKVLNLSKQYWYAPVSVAGLSLVLGYIYLRKKQTI